MLLSILQIMPDANMKPQAKHLQTRTEFLLKVLRRQAEGGEKKPVSGLWLYIKMFRHCLYYAKLNRLILLCSMITNSIWEQPTPMWSAFQFLAFI